jgi:hypothetical protein
MLNGIFVTGGDDGDGGIHVNFVSDHVRTIFGNGSKYDMTGAAPIISNRSATVGFLNNSAGDGIVIINTNINDVAMTVLPNAPIDDATGLPVPTIAVATDGGTSIIRDDGTVVDLTGFTPVDTIHIDESSVIGSVNTSGNDFLYKTAIPTTDTLYNTAITAGSYNYFLSSSGTSTPTLRDRDVSATAYDSKYDIVYRGGNNGFDVIKAGQAVSSSVSNPLISYITSDYNTGYQHGDIKLATLSDTDATNQTGGTVADRSVNNNSLNVTGTITRTAVTTGADLVAYSGFSGSNYLLQPYNSDMDYGTGDFYVMAWAKLEPTSGSFDVIFDRADSTSNPRIFLYAETSNSYSRILISNGSSEFYADGPSMDDGIWHQLIGVRRGDSILIYFDSVPYTPVACSGSVTNTSAYTCIGIQQDTATGAFGGSIALVRTGSGAPSPEQIKKMYDDEKFLFQENSQATLYGSSDAVTALAYDDATNLLHVGTSAGRSEFQGLRRINNTTVGITTAISASNELVAEQ